MKQRSKTIAELGVFTAIIIVLQIIATFINIGSFPITLTLIPIIIAGAVYGEKVGAYMGLVFGIIVMIMVITGADPNGLIMFTSHPFATTSAVIVKGVACGYVGALLFKLINKKNTKLALVISSVACPIVNTFTFYIFLILFFDGTIQMLAAYFISINFVIELLTNLLIAPYLTNLVIRNKKRYGE